MADTRTLPGVKVNRVLDDGMDGLNGTDKTNGVHSVVKRKPLDINSPLVKSKRTKPKQSYFRWFLSVFTRLLTWYSIITIVFRCPATQQDITDTTPKVCKPYFELRSTLLPHVTPYYEKYASPYVESAKPYYNVLDKNFITPAKVYGIKYGSPRYQQAQAVGKAQWEKQVQPQLTKANDIYRQKYDQYAAAHVNKIADTAGPYYKFAKDNAVLTYHASILPTYKLVHPYLLQGYEQGRHFTIHTGYPLAKRAWNATMIFLERNVFPKIKILYGENVEPQLIRIGERLGRYRDGKKVKAAVEEVNQSASLSSLSSTINAASSTVVVKSRITSTISVSSKPTTTTTKTISEVKATGSVKPAETPLTEAEQRAKAQKIVEDDLSIWQQKFSKATEEGSAELESRIAEITERAIQKQARVVGKAHLIRLEETVASEMKSLKKSILSIVKLKYTDEDINRAVRKAGLNIRDKAQAVREWRQKYDKETNELVAKAAEDTFQIIDHIRDLGLQEIGMRWAWTDGITHKDWTKYHALKNKFDEWRHDVEEVATQHPGLTHARNESEDIEGKAMSIAEDAAKELARLKETGKWKLQAGDASPDFDTKHMPVAAHQAAQKVMDIGRDAKEAVVGTASSQGTMEFLSSVAGENIGSMSASAASVAAEASAAAGGYAADASKSAQSAAASLSARLASTSTQGTVNSAISAAQASASSLAAKASASVVGTPQGTVESLASVASASASSLSAQASASAVSAASQASVSAESVVSQASASVYGTPQGSVESLASKASASIIGTSQGTMESVASVASASAASLASEASVSAESVASQASASVYGAPRGSIESIVSKASSAVAGTRQGSAESASSVAAASASSLAAQAAPVVGAGAQKIMGAAKEAASSVSSAASSVGSEASKSASSVASSVSPIVRSSASSASSVGSKSASSMSSQASKSASSASKVASSSALSASKIARSSASSASKVAASSASSASSAATKSSSSASAKASPKKVWGGAMAQEVKERHIIYEDVLEDDVVDSDETYSQKIQEMANHAGERFHDITKAVSEALHHQKATATQAPGAAASVTSLASAPYASALSAASVALYGTTTTPLGAGESVISVASSRYAEAVAAASAAIYGTPVASGNSAAARATAAYSEALSQANAHYSNALSMVSAQISGTPKPTHEAMFSSVQASYSIALAAANSRLASASSAASVAAYGAPTGVMESISSRASIAAYGTPTGIMESISAIASKRLAEGLAQASSQYSDVKSAVGATPTPQSQKYLDDAKARYYAAVGLAHDRYSEFVSSASAAVMPTPAPFHQSLYNQASGAVYGTTTGAAESAYSAAQSAYASAESIAKDNLNKALRLGKEQSSTGYAAAASSSYSSVLSAASVSMLSASKVASEAVYGTPIGTLDSLYSAAQAQFAQATAAAQSNLDAALNLAGKEKHTAGYVEAASSSYSSVLSAASASMESASREGSSRLLGSAKPTPELHGVLYGTPKAGNVHHDDSQGVLAQAQAQYAAATAAALDAYNNALNSGKKEKAPKAFTDQAASSYSSALAAASASMASVSKAASVRIYGTQTGAFESATKQAQAQYAAATAAAALALNEALNLGKGSKAATGYAEAASSSYSSVLSVASASMESASREASIRMYGTPTGAFESATSQAQAQYAAATAAAASALQDALKLGKKDKVPKGYAEAASSSYSSVLSVASASMESASREASIRMYGTPTGAVESLTSDVAASASSVASVASQNWESLVSAASVQVYGQPTPWAESVYAQATQGAGEQYAAMAALINELVSGKEPDFTESVMSRFSSAYHTPIGAVVSSASSIASSVGSAAAEIFTPPPAIEHILEAAQSRVNDAVEAASIQVYGTSKSPYEKVQESVSSVSSAASVRMYGSETGYVEAASSSIAAAASSAQDAILAAVYGESTPTPVYHSATSVAAEYASKITGAIYGAKDETREGSVASAQARLGEAVESARVKLAAFASMAGEGAEDIVSKASEGIEEFASSISSAVASEETVEHLGDAKDAKDVKDKAEKKVRDGDRGFHDEL